MNFKRIQRQYRNTESMNLDTMQSKGKLHRENTVQIVSQENTSIPNDLRSFKRQF